MRLFYIHGLNSSKNSRKFLELKQKYSEIECLDWTIEDDILLKIQDWTKIISNITDDILIIASSTGANFAYQLKLSIKTKNIGLVLINPLITLDSIYDSKIMPKNVAKYLIKIEKISNSLLLVAFNDEIINHKKLLENKYIVDNNHITLSGTEKHTFKGLHYYYDEIDHFANEIKLKNISNGNK